MAIRIGVMGCARIAQRSVIPAIQQLPEDFQLLAIASRDSTKAAQWADQFQCDAVTGYEALLSRRDLDALYVPLPTGLHREWVGKAIAAGKHVYVEKSFASTPQEAEAHVAAARGQGVAAMEGYMFLYHRQQAVVSKLIADGVLGELRHFHGCFGFPPLPPGDFRYDPDIGGGVLLDAAGYPLRAAHRFFGSDLQVVAAVLNPSRTHTLWGSAYLSNNRGLTASIAFGFDNSYQCRYEIWGSKCRLVAERAYTPSPTFSPRLHLETAAGVQTIDVEPDDHFVGALLAFRDAIRNTGKREAHYCDILNQSRALGRIRELSAPANQDISNTL